MSLKIFLPAVLGMALIFVGGNAWGAITTCASGVSNQDVCIGEPLKFDDEANVLTVINDNLLDPAFALTSLVSLGKNENPGGGDGVVTSEADGFSGTWSFSDAVAFVSVKANGSFKVFDVMGADNGTWDTFGILTGGANQPEWSHLNFWQTDPKTVVPLPAAAWLFISGLGALGVLRRQQKAK